MGPSSPVFSGKKQAWLKYRLHRFAVDFFQWILAPACVAILTRASRTSIALLLTGKILRREVFALCFWLKQRWLYITSLVFLVVTVVQIS